MSDIITGTLQVDSRVVLNTADGAVEVLIFPLQAAVAWEVMVARTVEAFRQHNGQRVTLEGTLQGQILSSARLAEGRGLRDGSYRGRLESDGGAALGLELRLEGGQGVMSADLFRDGNYYCSMRARMRDGGGGALVATDPRFIFDWNSESAIGGRLELTPRGGSVVQVNCVVPEAMPTLYRGEAVFDSEYFRVINIEVDKLEGMPWPPEYSTGDIPQGNQPSDIGVLSVSLGSLFQKAGFDARIRHNDAALPSDIGRLTGRPGEEDRWDEREMHEMMDRNYSRSLSEREWWLYLLIVARFDGGPKVDDQGNVLLEGGSVINGGRGTTGIIFDNRAGRIRDPWSGFAEWFERNNPQKKHLFDFGREGDYVNSRARQGVAVFWREMQDFMVQQDDWYRSRQMLRTVVHELGHALNLAHTWLVGRADTTSFMNYPHNYPHGGTPDTRVRNYWNRFDYSFDPEELFHLRHGFYNEVIPGGKNDFMQWTSSSVFRDPTAGGTRANLSMSLSPTKTEFRFTEPVTIEVELRNHTADDIPLGRLSPAYGDIDIVVRKPNGEVERYQPPLFKCETTPSVLEANSSRKHVTSLAVDARGFTFDAPGRYEITASTPDPSSGVMVVARPVTIWVRYPEKQDENIARDVFTSDAGLFLYMGGGEHLARAKGVLEGVADEHQGHPFAAHADLVLGLNLLAGQKSAVRGRKTTPSKPEAARHYLERALGSGAFSEPMTNRLKATLSLIDGGGDGDGGDGPGGGRGGGA